MFIVFFKKNLASFPFVYETEDGIEHLFLLCILPTENHFSIDSIGDMKSFARMWVQPGVKNRGK